MIIAEPGFWLALASETDLYHPQAQLVVEKETILCKNSYAKISPGVSEKDGITVD